MFRGLFISLLIFSVHALAEGPGPENGHKTMRAGIDGGVHQTRGAALGLSYRFALHDFLDRQTGYPSDTQLEAMSFRVEYFPKEGKTYLDEVILFRLLRLPPVTRAWEELSWKVEIGGRSLKDPATCDRCGAGNVLGGLGVTFQPVESIPVDVWMLLETELLLAPALAGFPVKPSLGPRMGLRFRLLPFLNGTFYGLYRRQLTAPTHEIWEYGSEWRVSIFKNWALNARFVRFGEGWQGSLGVYSYF